MSPEQSMHEDAFLKQAVPEGQLSLQEKARQAERDRIGKELAKVDFYRDAIGFGYALNYVKDQIGDDGNMKKVSERVATYLPSQDSSGAMQALVIGNDNVRLLVRTNPNFHDQEQAQKVLAQFLTGTANSDFEINVANIRNLSFPDSSALEVIHPDTVVEREAWNSMVAFGEVARNKKEAEVEAVNATPIKLS